MKFNKLDYRTIDNNYLSIEILVDEKPIKGLVEADNRALPFYDFEKNELPRGYQENDYILGVCSCGDAGCGSAECEIVREKDWVVFRNFKYGHSLPQDTEFRFTHENYDSIMQSIFEEIKNYKLTTDRVNKRK